ncbi:MAG: ATP-dependent Clp protease adaptor ClpS, partial [Planctomycetaceae bacterium]
GEPVTPDEPAVAVAEPIVRPKHRREESGTKPKRQPPYAVVVHNDDFHTFPYVIECLQKVCGYDLAKAEVLTVKIHYSGQAHVWSGALEVAELKRDQIRGFGPDFYAPEPVKFPLGVTIEPLPGE